MRCAFPPYGLLGTRRRAVREPPLREAGTEKEGRTQGNPLRAGSGVGVLVGEGLRAIDT